MAMETPGGRWGVGVCEVTLVLIQETQALLLHGGPVHGRLDPQHVHLLLQVGPAVTSGNSINSSFKTLFHTETNDDNNNSTQGDIIVSGNSLQNITQT